MAKSLTGLDYTNVRTGGWVELEDRALIEEYKKGGTLPEISIALTKRLKRPITASAIKDRAYYLRLRGVEIPQLPRSRPSLDKPEPATPLNPLERRAALDKAAVARKEMEGLVDQVNEFKARQAFLDAAAGFKAPPVLLPREKKSGIRELCPIVLASDWHVEENVDPESVARRNIYSLEIAEERMERFWQGIMWNIEHHRASGKVAIRDLVLWLGGDLITGYIHPELVEIAELSPTGAIRWLIGRLRNGIATLLERLKLDRLVIPCSYGNHGRTSDKPRIATGAHNSFEWLMYHMIANEFRDEERIVFEITASAHQYVDVFGSIVHFHHGDEVRYNGGIGGLGIPLLKAIPSWELVKPAALHCLGHHHTLRDFGRAVVNGSLIGYTPYSQSIRCEFELPQQAMFFWDRSRGKCMFTPLWVSDLEKDKKRGIGINAGT